MISSVRIVPRPGISKPNSASGRHATGSNNNDLSIVPTIRFSTHSVITRGTRIRRPVTKYLRMMFYRKDGVKK
jgi:hypothetical protein